VGAVVYSLGSLTPTLKMEAIYSTEMIVTLYHVTRYKIRRDSSLYIYRCEDVRSQRGHEVWGAPVALFIETRRDVEDTKNCSKAGC
jgi:hypothetical protein